MTTQQPAPRSWSDYRARALAGLKQKDQKNRTFVRGMDCVFALLEAEFPPANVCQAAPKLLRACKELSMLRDIMPCPTEHNRLVSFAQRAIADAESTT